MKGKHSSRIKRLINLASFITNHEGVEVETVCEVFGLTRRQLASVLDEMMMCGVPPYGPSDYITGWLEDDRVTMSNAEFMRRPLPLTVREAVSLKIALDGYVGRGDGEDVLAATSLAGKIGSVLGHRDGRSAKPEPFSVRTAILKRAVAESRVVQIVYYSREADEITVRDIEPLLMVNIGSISCVAAYCRFRNDEKAFSIERIREVRLLDERFEKPDGFDHGEYSKVEYWARTATDAVIRVDFAPRHEAWVMERFANARIKQDDDGALRVFFQVEDAHWIADVAAAFHCHVSVEGPEKCGDLFHGILDRIEALYSDDGSGEADGDPSRSEVCP